MGAFLEKVNHALSLSVGCDILFSDAMFRFRPYIIHPKLTEEWVHGSLSGGPATEQVADKHSFKYYVAINDLANPNCLLEAESGPLVHLLKRNQPMGPFATEEEAIFLCSSMETAMTLGFYAYRMTELKLVQVSSHGLLGGKAPVSHPMGNFWILPWKMVADWVGRGSVSLTYAPFEMCCVGAGPVKSSEEIYKEAASVNLRKRKAELMADIVDLRDQLNHKEMELRGINHTLASTSPTPQAAEKTPQNCV